MVLLTGAGGSAGSAFLEHALGAHAVTAITRRPLQAQTPPMRVCIADLADPGAWTDHARDADHIVHLAASRADRKDKDLYEDIPIAGRLLDCWSRGRFVFASSQIVYASCAPSPLAENAPTAPHNWYGASKLAIENMIVVEHARRAARKEAPEGFGYVIYRLPAVVQPGRGKAQFLDQIAAAATMGVDFCFNCDEEQARRCGTSWIGGDDLARALLHAVDAVMPSGIYNVHSGYVGTVEAIEAVIARTGSRSRVLFDTAGEGVDVPLARTQLDTTKIAATGFVPRDALLPIVDRHLAALR